MTGMVDVLDLMDRLPRGYSEGLYEGRRYGATMTASEDGKRRKLYAEALAGGDHVSCNLYVLEDGSILLKPCEMPQEKVIAFLCGYKGALGI